MPSTAAKPRRRAQVPETVRQVRPRGAAHGAVGPGELQGAPAPLDGAGAVEPAEVVHRALQGDRRGHLVIAPAESRTALLPRALVHLLRRVRVVARHRHRAQHAVAQRARGEGAQLLGERRGRHGVAGLQHPGQRDEQPPAALLAVRAQPTGRHEVSRGARPLLPRRRPVGEPREVVGERGVERGGGRDPVVQHRDLVVDEPGGGEVQRRAPGRAERVVQGGADERVGERQRPGVARGVRDQQAAAHGLVDGLHRLGDPADGRRERQRRPDAQHGRGVEQVAGLGPAGGVAVADQPAERAR